MKTLFATHALLADGWAQNVRIAVDDRGRIARIEKGARHNDARDGEKLDILIPGMTSAHSHVFQAAMRGRTDTQDPAHPDDDFWTWRDTMYTFANRITPDDQRALADYVYGEMVKAGYTGVAEFHYLHHRPDGKSYDPPTAMSDAVIDGAKDIGIALMHLPTAYQRGGFKDESLNDGQQRFNNSTEQFLELVRDLRGKHQDDNIQVGIALHSLRAVSPQELKKILTAPEVIQGKFPIHLHIAEQPAEVEDCRRATKQLPVAWLMDELSKPEYKALDKSRLVLVHATHATHEELDKAKDAGVTICYCPATEAHLGDGIPDAAYWVKSGGATAIGSDENGVISPFAELKMAEDAQRLKHKKRQQLSADGGNGLWTMAAMGGARAAGLDAGEIAVGKRADLVALDGAMFKGLAAEHILDAAILTPGIGKNPVRHTMVNGRWVVAGGALIAPEIRQKDLPLDQLTDTPRLDFDQRVADGYLKALDKLNALDGRSGASSRAAQTSPAAGRMA